MKVTGTTIAVTGGGNGIGRQLVLALLARGARVAALDVNEDGLKATIDLAGDRADRLSTHVVNITDRAAVEALPEQIIAEHGQVDGLINCAGVIQPFVPMDKLEYKDIERVMDINFWGVVHTTKAFLPHLVTRPAAHIVNVSSMGGFIPVPGQTIYGASKAAVKLLTEGLHSELTQTPVSVTVVFPGAIETEITKNSGVEMHGKPGTAAKQPQRKMTSPADAARIIIDAMERDAYRVTIGKDSAMLDRLARLSPRRSAALIYKQMKDLLD
ncbi:SDR family NAD(P)-dependent oxidoreductase [Cellulomonas chengniuliangii]|uniref:SDR family oxidoreductase n=1 Tax=Cellulomonas chengniuliangii TaxID=2968084 RepID=A0ABY5KVA6_9CELL|nr:SDR family oxidoreductase [Cellulomonas chengniuliangii]MCC2308886.1 SDR family oxidoreductase [Cellulomonas chengniuliangii]MCC2317113.1 SDR family oxidoreductase [Cellulomonas chengniuliangii]UUI74374.1 SDR family oxidoreductase [Cellulomonas chengniuliangii]